MHKQALYRIYRIVLAAILLWLPVLGWAIQEPDTELTKLLQEAVTDASSFDDRFDAEVWLVDMSSRLKRYIKDPKERVDFLQAANTGSL